MVRVLGMAWVLAAATVPGGLAQVLALEEAGRDGEALVAARGLVDREPSSALAHLETARLQLKAGLDLEAAARHLAEAQRLAPENPRARYYTGLLSEEQGRDAEARAAYAEALALRASYASARERLAALCTRSGDWPCVEIQARALIGAGAGSPSTGIQLALAVESQGKNREAERTLASLHRSQPANPVVTRALAGFLERHGQRQRAAELRRRVDPAPRKLRALRSSR